MSRKCASNLTGALLTRGQSTHLNKTADSAPGVVTWDVTLSARNVVPCVRSPATSITAPSL